MADLPEDRRSPHVLRHTFCTNLADAGADAGTIREFAGHADIHTTTIYTAVATRAGRRVEITTGRGIVEVAEVTRTGEPVRTARFMASRVVALVEHPASEDRWKRGTSEDLS
jgi:hypothetical protein